MDNVARVLFTDKRDSVYPPAIFLCENRLQSCDIHNLDLLGSDNMLVIYIQYNIYVILLK